jgi:hypothetical protein
VAVSMALVVCLTTTPPNECEKESARVRLNRIESIGPGKGMPKEVWFGQVDGWTGGSKK